MKRAILASANAQLILDVKAMLPLLRFNLMTTTDNGMEALRYAHRFEPDLIIMGWDLRGLNSSEVLQNLIGQHLCPIIVILAQEEQHVLSEVIAADVHQVILYPLRALDMAAAIQIAEQRFKREAENYQKIQRLEEDLKTRKLIFQAMLSLIHLRSYSEEAAYAALRNQAMSTRKSLRAVAQDVIKGYWIPEPDLSEGKEL